MFVYLSCRTASSHVSLHFWLLCLLFVSLFVWLSVSATRVCLSAFPSAYRCLVSACYSRSICEYIYALRKPHSLVKQCVKEIKSESFRSWCPAGGSATLGGPRSTRAIWWPGRVVPGRNTITCVWTAPPRSTPRVSPAMGAPHSFTFVLCVDSYPVLTMCRVENWRAWWVQNRHPASIQGKTWVLSRNCLFEPLIACNAMNWPRGAAISFYA